MAEILDFMCILKASPVQSGADQNQTPLPAIDKQIFHVQQQQQQMAVVATGLAARGVAAAVIATAAGATAAAAASSLNIINTATNKQRSAAD